ncbi:ficolin-2-like [Stylophora pistillata]|uniref:ficolin-2-like n=1 Tax=Stylophora pistillata TaxID=50429 RepID=UPI000C04F001|nr:ficolin-2-like [Stylophora pistillata]
MYLIKPLLASLAIAFTCGDPRIITPVFRAVNFAREIRGRRLNGSVFREIEVDSEGLCQLQCVEESSCVSYNFGSRTNKKFKCQLSDSDRFTNFKNFTKDNEFLYRGVMSDCEFNSSLCAKNQICVPNYKDNTAECKCGYASGYTGKPCVTHTAEALSCQHLLKDGVTSSGVYTINPDGGKPIQVLCDMATDGGGWTIFQRRLDGSVDFDRDWKTYKDGFGNPIGEFWLGNDNLHRLTATNDVMLRVDLEDFEGNITYAKYATFNVTDEAENYTLTLGGYTGEAGDSFTSHSDNQFSTKDRDNDQSPFYHCARDDQKGGWWFDNPQCVQCNLNGLYNVTSGQTGVIWKDFRGLYYSLKRSEMKIKPKDQ